MVSFKQTPSISRPRPCIGAMLDIPFGEYHKGKYGDMLLSGGLSSFLGVAARGNMYKTTLCLSMALRVYERYCNISDDAGFALYDTELTGSWARLSQIANTFNQGRDTSEDIDKEKLIITTSAEYFGNQWWSVVIEQGKSRANAFKSIGVQTPFIDRKGNPVKTLPPFIHLLDSLSMLVTEEIDKVNNANEIGDSKSNTVAMRDGAHKTQLVMQAPNVTTQSGFHLIATAHLGDEVKTDPYQPSTQKLQYVKKGLKFKNVPEKFTFLTSGCWVITDAQPLIRQDKTPEYPLEGYKDNPSDPDLQLITIVNARSKHGPTGHAFKLVISQNEGLLPSLSEFNNLKSRKDKFGLQGPEGIHKDFRLSLYPDVLLKRTRVRDQINADPKLQRALEITSELAQIYDYWSSFPNERRISPEQLKEGLEKKGYDWNRLLDTRGYWTFDHYTHPVAPLSTMDLINMYFDEYVPWWYNQDNTKTKKGKST